MNRYAKAITAAIGAALMVLDGIFLTGAPHIVILVLLAAGTAAGVWAVPNATAPAAPAVPVTPASSATPPAPPAS